MVSLETPLAPSVTEVGVGVLNISWLFEAIDAIFFLTIVNLNNSGEPLRLSTRDLFCVVTSPDNISCELYQFRVTTRDAAGNTSSGYVTSTFPSLPAPPAEDSIQHSLEKTARGISLCIKINVNVNHAARLW